MTTNELRAQIYETLSECFKEPSPEFAGDVSEGRLYDFLTEAFRELNIAQDLDGLQAVVAGGQEITLVALKEQYDDLFNHPFKHLVPVESVYGETRSFLGEPARDMLALYAEAGLQIPAPFAAMPDHLCLLLEFMAGLCRMAPEEKQSQFVAKHLGWLERLEQDNAKRPEAFFYRAALAATVAFVRLERQRLKVAPGEAGEGGFKTRPYERRPMPYGDRFENSAAGYPGNSSTPATALSGGER